MNVLDKTRRRVCSLSKNALVIGNGRQHTEDAYYLTHIVYDRNTSITMRLEVNYLVIAPTTLKYITAWIVEASVNSGLF